MLCLSLWFSRAIEDAEHSVVCDWSFLWGTRAARTLPEWDWKTRKIADPLQHFLDLSHLGCILLYRYWKRKLWIAYVVVETIALLSIAPNSRIWKFKLLGYRHNNICSVWFNRLPNTVIITSMTYYYAIEVSAVDNFPFIDPSGWSALIYDTWDPSSFLWSSDHCSMDEIRPVLNECSKENSFLVLYWLNPWHYPVFYYVPYCDRCLIMI